MPALSSCFSRSPQEGLGEFASLQTTLSKPLCFHPSGPLGRGGEGDAGSLSTSHYLPITQKVAHSWLLQPLPGWRRTALARLPLRQSDLGSDESSAHFQPGQPPEPPPSEGGYWGQAHKPPISDFKRGAETQDSQGGGEDTHHFELRHGSAQGPFLAIHKGICRERERAELERRLASGWHRAPQPPESIPGNSCPVQGQGA